MRSSGEYTIGINLVLATLGAYLLGCFSTGYYLIRVSTGVDIRNQGSGSTGASNVCRNHGAVKAAVTFLGDFGKGALAVYLALHFSAGPGIWTAMSVMLAVVAGHIWPAQLRFHGGKGVATALGALLVLDARLTLGLVVVLALLRQFTRSGLVTIALTPVVAIMAGRFWLEVFSLVALSCVLLAAHHKNLREWWKAARGRHLPVSAPPPVG